MLRYQVLEHTLFSRLLQTKIVLQRTYWTRKYMSDK